MKHSITNIGKVLLTAGAGLLAVSTASAVDASVFPSVSPLAQGKWVKITIGETGVYEITYDELRAMGFSNPEKVGIYGNGGRLLPTQFVPASTADKPYTSTLTPVAMARMNDKIYFFGEDPLYIRYYTEKHNQKNAQRFQLKSNNVFTNAGIYFLSDAGPEINEIKMVEDGFCNTLLPEYNQAWDYFYHEKDEYTYSPSGREFFGENFLRMNKLSVPYSMPGGIVDGEASLVCRFLANVEEQTSTLTYGLSADGEENREGSVSIDKLGEMRNYMSAEPGFLSLTLPAQEGTIEVNYDAPSGCAFAGLDYLLLGSKRKLEFQPGEVAVRAFVYDYSSNTHGNVRLDNAPANLVAWDVTDTHSVKALPVKVKDDKGYIQYLANNKKEGMLVAFDASAQQKKVTGFEQVPNQNLHALGLDKIPSMLIITLPELMPAAERIAQIHKEIEGIDVAIVLSDEVVNEFSAGVPDPMAYRALAKMLYDRDDPQNRVFKNLLLLGPSIRDNRNVLGIVPPIGTLISNQSYLSRDIDNTYCLSDWYGMLDDTTAYPLDSMNLYRVPMQIGIGMIPVNTLAEAMVIADKVAASYADTSYAQWLGEYVYAADGTNDNEHQKWCERLTDAITDISGQSVVARKLYNNLYAQGVTKKEFKNRMKEGTFISTYVGHASSTGLNTEFWKLGDERTLQNRRLGFMNFAACSVSPFDNNDRGLGISMLTEPGKGIVGTILTARSGYSVQNYEFMDRVQKSFLRNDINSSALLSGKRTLGEAYIIAKNDINYSNNEFAYHLIADPALVLPFPTASVEAAMDENEGINPGTLTHFAGSVVDREGKKLTGFNGSVVVKLYAAPITQMTSSRFGSPNVEVKLDESLLTSGEFEVKNGEFDGDIFIPVSITPTTDEQKVSLRMSAYDPTTRTSALGVMHTSINQIDESKIDTADLPPIINSMYVNTPLHDTSMPVGTDFTLYAEVEDDKGLLFNDLNGMSMYSLMVDGYNNQGSLTDASTITDGGRKLYLCFPMSGLTPGRHTLTLNVADGMEHTASRTIEVYVGENPMGATLAVAETPARTIATISFAETADCESAVIDILDARGRLVVSASMQGDKYEWTLKDASGSRVEPGIYYAVARMYRGGVAVGVSDTAEIIVFK